MPIPGNNPSREISPYLYSAYLARQMDDSGTVRCAYCTREIEPHDRTLDHVEGGKGGYDSGDLVVASCSECNGAAGNHSDRAHEILAAHLRGLDVEPHEAARRVKKILRMPLPDRNDPDVLRIAEEHFGERLVYQRRIAALRRGTDPATAGTGRTRARRLAAATAADDFDVF